MRAFRIIDGADEVQKRTIAREVFEVVRLEERESLPRLGDTAD